MSSFWWTLPGPSLFLADVESELRKGRNVFVLLPAISPPGLHEALVRHLRAANLWDLRTVSLSLKAGGPDLACPARFVAERAGTSVSRS